MKWLVQQQANIYSNAMLIACSILGLTKNSKRIWKTIGSLLPASTYSTLKIGNGKTEGFTIISICNSLFTKKSFSNSKPVAIGPKKPKKKYLPQLTKPPNFMVPPGLSKKTFF